jgi:hypothetical protein
MLAACWQQRTAHLEAGRRRGSAADLVFPRKTIMCTSGAVVCSLIARVFATPCTTGSHHHFASSLVAAASRQPQRRGNSGLSTYGAAAGPGQTTPDLPLQQQQQDQQLPPPAPLLQQQQQHQKRRPQRRQHALQDKQAPMVMATTAAAVDLVLPQVQRAVEQQPQQQQQSKGLLQMAGQNLSLQQQTALGAYMATLSGEQRTAVFSSAQHARVYAGTPSSCQDVNSVYTHLATHTSHTCQTHVTH